MQLHTAELVLIGITLLAACVNGGVGYGFSSITVPVALLFFPNRVLNPALVLVEVGINLAVFYANRRVWRRAWQISGPLLLGTLPGVVLGSLLLSSAGHEALRIGTYVVLLPLIVAQTAGWRFPMRLNRLTGAAIGTGVGALYAATTISGPPLALFLNNQGLAKEDFRAAMSLFRIVESTTTACCYLALGLFSAQSLRTSGIMVPGVLLGLVVGQQLLRSLKSDTFRRICMATDALLVGFGLARTALGLQLVGATVAYGGLAAIAAIEVVLVLRYLLGGGANEAWEASGTAVAGRALDYPVALNLTGRRVLVVGAGRVAEDRISALLAAGADVRVVATAATERVHEWADQHRLRLSERPYEPGDCEGAQLVLTAVGVPEVSRAVAAEARGRGLLVNSADLPELCDFNLPSVGRRGPVTIAVSTSGLAPSLARFIRQRAMATIGPEYGVVARLLGRLRKLLPGGAARARLFGDLLASDLVPLIRQGKRELARERVRELVQGSAAGGAAADSTEGVT
jgi:siroheme synthase-like protein